MRERLALFSALAVIAGCGPTAPSPAARSSVESPSGLARSGAEAIFRRISLGEEVTGTLVAHDSHGTFELTAAADAQVVAGLTWNPADGTLELWLDDELIGPADNDGSIAARFSVSAGGTYRIIVADAAPWDYGGLNLTFTLTTSAETSTSP